jgi:putative flippase GtrA
MTSRDFIGTKVSRFGERVVRGTLYRGLAVETPVDSVQADVQPGGAGAIELMKKPVVRQFIKFCIVGGSSTVIDVGLHGLFMIVVHVEGQPLGVVLGKWLLDTMPGLFFFASDPTGASFPVLKIATAGLAIINSFYWNRLWTFNIRGKEERAVQLRKFVVVALIGMALNTIIGTACKNIIPGHPTQSWAVASAIATIAVAFWNFFGQSLWTFRKRHS